jgi:peptide/nickel transport system ATP-binding protein
MDQGMGVLFITHDLGVVARIADRVAIMYKGEVVEERSAGEIFSAPGHPYTKALIACRPAQNKKGERLPTVSDFMGKKNESEKIISQTPVIASGETLVKVENLVVRFPGKRSLLGKPLSFTTAVDHISFEVKKGETLGLVGESGCGKTTAGRTLLGLVQPDEGRIVFETRNITHLNKKELREWRKDVQLIFQDPYSSLNPRLSVGEAIEEPIRNAGLERSSSARRKKVVELLDRVNLPASVMSRYPHEFSGGQRQRIVIARALGLQPSFLVCDESVSALDVSVQAQVLNLLNELKRDLGLTMLFISHDLSVVRYMCDRIMVMRRGKIVESGTSEEVYDHPRNEYTKSLIEAIPRI